MLFRPGLLGRIPCPQDWYVSSGPPTVDENFNTGSLPAGWTFTRASIATDSTWQDNPNQSTYNTLANNVPIINQWGIKVEPTTTNLFLNSDAPVTQSITLPINAILTVWMVGPGSLTLSNGTGVFSNLGTVTNGAPRTVTCTTAGTITITVTGTVYRVQAERNLAPTSYIPSGGTAQTRQPTQLSKNYLGGQLNVNNGTYWLECYREGYIQNNETLLSAGVGSFSAVDNTDNLVFLSGQLNVASFRVNAPGSTAQPRADSPNAFLAGRIDRIAATYDPQRIAICTNYGVVTPASIAARPPTLLAVCIGGGANGNYANMYVRGFRYWPTTMSDAELHECTGPGYYGSKPVFDLDGTVANQWRMWTYTRTSGTGIVTDALMSDPAGTAYAQYGTGAVPGTGTIPFTPRGLLLDGVRSNYLINSDALAASGTTATLGIQGYTLSVRGSGSVTITANTAVSPDLPVTATQGNPARFTVTTAGTVNYTRTGTIEIAQLEQCGTYNMAVGQDQGPTTFIKTGAVAQTRGSSGISIPCGPWFTNVQGTYYTELLLFARCTGTYLWGIDDTTGSNREQIFAAYGTTGMLTWGSNTIYRGFNPGRIDPDVSQQPWSLSVHKVAVAVSSDRKRQIAMDGVLGATGALRQGGDDGGAPRPSGALIMKIGMNQTGNVPVNMFVRRWRYYDYAIFDDALKALTT